MNRTSTKPAETTTNAGGNKTFEAVFVASCCSVQPRERERRGRWGMRAGAVLVRRRGGAARKGDGVEKKERKRMTANRGEWGRWSVAREVVTDEELEVGHRDSDVLQGRQKSVETENEEGRRAKRTREE
ncbi:hypothetical protein CRG98_017775 [Punica granatum]|uniref:Uncharacterized protein n=1 Tax=Punica granatum TaxID=22663 RepID=A0A2I0JZY7_PUNGR|nr:hypothetical protein CRG98_017775 [Punica granatum]